MAGVSLVVEVIRKTHSMVSIAALLLGLIASGLLAAISYSTSNKTITILSCLMSVTVCVQYTLLGRPSAAALSVVSLVFSIVALLMKNSEKWRWQTVLPAMLVSMTVTSWFFGGITMGYEALPLLGSILMGSLIMFHKPAVIKSVQFVAGVIWTVYQVHVGAWGQIPGEVIYFITWGASVRTMIARYLKNRPEEYAPAPDAALV